MNVVELHPNPSRVTPNVVNRLEALLEKARNGEIVSLAFITIDGSGNVGYGFETDLALKHAHHMVAGSVYLQRHHWKKRPTGGLYDAP